MSLGAGGRVSSRDLPSPSPMFPLVFPSSRAPHLAVVQTAVAKAGVLAQPFAGGKLFFLQRFSAQAEGADLLIGELCFC